MTTEDIIKSLEQIENTNYSHYSAPKICTMSARMRLQELQKQRDDAYIALDSANVALKELKQKLEAAKSELKLHRDEINYWSEKWKEQENTRKEPSRLEIAAMLFSKSSNPFSDDSMHVDEAFRYADALIAQNRRAK